MGGPLHNRRSSHRRSVPSSWGIRKSPRAEPLERGQTLKVLCLVPNSLWVSFSPIVSITFSPFYTILLFALKLSFGSTEICWRTHSYICTPIIPGGFFNRSLLILFSEHQAHHTYAFFPYVFSSPLYASIWLKFWPSWVAWLLCLPLRSRLFG